MKVFCLSMQRTGTTSVGRFLRDNDFNVCGWRESKLLKLSEHWYDGNYDALFDSIELGGYNGFEDSPWYYPGFEREIFPRYPHAKYILIERDPDSWFRSMMTHSGGMNPGATHIHARIYDREADLENLRRDKNWKDSDWNGLELSGRSVHYTRIYRDRNTRCREYLQSVGADLYLGNLEQMDWEKIADFIGIDHPKLKSTSTHANKSKGRRAKQFLRSVKKSLVG